MSAPVPIAFSRAETSQTLVSRLERTAGETPDKIFCHFHKGATRRDISYGELLRQAKACAAWIAESGDAEIVCLKLGHHPALFPLFVGAILAGKIPTILSPPSRKQDTQLYWEGQEELFRRLKHPLVITARSLEASLAPYVGQGEITVHFVEDLDLDRSVPATSPALPALSPDEAAFLQHSSGTTSVKKGVMVTHRQLLSQTEAYARSIGMDGSDIVASWLPYYHDMGLIACFLIPLCLGATIVAIDPFEWVARPGLLLRSVETHRATLCWLPNFAFHHLTAGLSGKTPDLSSLRAIFNCSEPCRPETFAAFAERFAHAGIPDEKLQVCYAMAETVFAVSQTIPGHSVRRLELDREALSEGRVLSPEPGRGTATLLSCGTPVSGAEVAILGAEGSPLSAGEVGEIAVRAPFLFQGYFAQPEETARRFHGPWFLTRDEGFLHDGELYVTGRVDDVLIAYGRKYYAHDIESLLNGVPGVHPGRVVALAAENGRSGTRDIVVAFETGTEGDGGEKRREIRDLLAERLDMTVGGVIHVPPGFLVKTTSGKISRRDNFRKLVREGLLKTSL